MSGNNNYNESHNGLIISEDNTKMEIEYSYKRKRKGEHDGEFMYENLNGESNYESRKFENNLIKEEENFVDGLRMRHME